MNKDPFKEQDYEKNELHNRSMHIRGMFEGEVDIQNELRSFLNKISEE